MEAGTLNDGEVSSVHCWLRCLRSEFFRRVSELLTDSVNDSVLCPVFCSVPCFLLRFAPRFLSVMANVQLPRIEDDPHCRA